MSAFRPIVIVAIFATKLFAAENIHRLDLGSIVKDPAALRQVIISYSAADQPTVLYVFGTGRVVTQPVPSNTMIQIVPTCTAQVSEDKIKEILQLMIDRQFFDLEELQFLILYASLSDDDPVTAIKLHNIRISDGKSVAHRAFGTGVYGKEQQTIPEDFAVVERALLKLRDSAFEAVQGKPCRIAPQLKF